MKLAKNEDAPKPLDQTEGEESKEEESNPSAKTHTSVADKEDKENSPPSMASEESAEKASAQKSIFQSPTNRADNNKMPKKVLVRRNVNATWYGSSPDPSER
eukprot:g13842.t1 g13842   contig9:581779-582084(+)